jgi:hypothetical protein
MDRTGQQLVDLVGGQVDGLLGQREDVAHTHADEDVSGAVGTSARLDVALELVALAWRAERFQPRHERFGGGGHGHVRHDE